MLAYLRVLADPDDEVSARRIVNIPRRGIGGTSVSRLAAWAQFNHVSFSDAVDRAADAGLNGKALRGAEQLSKTLAELRPLMHTMNPADFVQLVADRTGYKAELVAEHTYEADSRIENLAEMAAQASNFDDVPGFLETVASAAESDERGPRGHTGLAVQRRSTRPGIPSLPRAGLVAHAPKCSSAASDWRSSPCGATLATVASLKEWTPPPELSVATSTDRQFGGTGAARLGRSYYRTLEVSNGGRDGLAFQPRANHCGAERRSSHRSAPQGFTCAAGHRWTPPAPGRQLTDHLPHSHPPNELSPG